MSECKQGIYGKYIINKADGSDIDQDAKYFVLRYDQDPVAWFALRSYALNTDNEQLRKDLLAELRQYRNDKTDDAMFVWLEVIDKQNVDLSDIRAKLEAAEKERDSLKLNLESKSLWAATWEKAYHRIEQDRDNLQAKVKDAEIVAVMLKDELMNLQVANGVLAEELENIAKNSCCDSCREAGLVAKKALDKYRGGAE